MILYLKLPSTNWFVIPLGATDTLAVISLLYTLNARDDDSPSKQLTGTSSGVTYRNQSASQAYAGPTKGNKSEV